MATDKLKFEVEGLEDLEKQLLRLESKVAEKELRKALTKAAVPVVRTAKSIAPVDTGALRQAIGRRIRKGRGTNVASVFVGVIATNKKALALANASRSKPIKGVFYGHIVELGYGRQRPQPFLREALDSEAANSTKIFGAELKSGIESVARK